MKHVKECVCSDCRTKALLEVWREALLWRKAVADWKVWCEALNGDCEDWAFFAQWLDSLDGVDKP